MNILLLVTVAGFCACQDGVTSLKEAQAAFTSQLVSNIESSTNGNFVLSPYSLHSTFSQIISGAGGRTKKELERVLRVGGVTDLTEQYSRVRLGLSKGDVQLREANMLAVDKALKLKKEFRRALQAGFQSSVREFDFARKGPEAVQKVRFLFCPTLGV